MRELCVRIGVPTPEIYGELKCYAELRRFQDLLGKGDDFVVKPSNGSAGRGVLVVMGKTAEGYVRHNGEILAPDKLRQHLSAILSGMYSLGGRPDRALIQQRVRLHPAFEPLSYKGIPDIRVIVYRNEPTMAMLRLPTKASNGRANLHQGGLGAGVAMKDGRTNHAVQRNRSVTRHPDTGASIVGMQVPFWHDVLEMSRKVSVAVGLGYLGVDIVVDENQGPKLLEANARPGLAIQIANNEGLWPRLEAVDRMLAKRGAKEEVVVEEAVEVRRAA
jgi:alpha-L-glutamate ligase-like protein